MTVPAIAMLSIDQVRAELESIFDLVAQGEQVILTLDDRSVARLIGLDSLPIVYDGLADIPVSTDLDAVDLGVTSS